MVFDLHSQRQKLQQEAVEQCIDIIQNGSVQDKYRILPKISVVRDECFLKPLLRILKTGSRQEREFAALAVGALERNESLDSLYEALLANENHRGAGNQSLQAAIIVAMGEIGNDDVVPYLRKAMDFTYKGDNFVKKRQKLILSAAAHIAQQGGKAAVDFIKAYLSEADPSMRAHALSELSIAYWHRPNEIPRDILEKFVRLTQDRHSEVRSAAVSSLANLADLGCDKAQDYFDSFEFAKSG
jgi:HEAT repeat protein